MVRYIVLWKLTPQAHEEGTAAVAKKLDESVASLVGRIPGLERASVYLNQAENSVHDLIFFTEFENREDIPPYRAHPLHVAHAKMAEPYVTDREVIEFEL